MMCLPNNGHIVLKHFCIVHLVQCSVETDLDSLVGVQHEADVVNSLLWQGHAELITIDAALAKVLSYLIDERYQVLSIDFSQRLLEELEKLCRWHLDSRMK